MRLAYLIALIVGVKIVLLLTVARSEYWYFGPIIVLAVTGVHVMRRSA